MNVALRCAPAAKVFCSWSQPPYQSGPFSLLLGLTHHRELFSISIHVSLIILHRDLRSSPSPTEHSCSGLKFHLLGNNRSQVECKGNLALVFGLEHVSFHINLGGSLSFSREITLDLPKFVTASNLVIGFI